MVVYSNGRVHIQRSLLEGVNGWIVSPVRYKLRSVCAPILFVYPDARMDSAEQTAAYLSETGIEDYILKEYAAAVVFAPRDRMWGPLDVEAYMAVIQNFTDNSDVIVEAGVVQGYAPGEFVKFDPHPEGKYSGSTGRLYVLGEGKGADFAAQYLVSSELAAPTPWGALIHMDPTGMVLIGASSSLGRSEKPVAAALYACGENVRAQFKELNEADREAEGVWYNAETPAQRVMIRESSSPGAAFREGLNFLSSIHRYSLGRNSSRLLLIPDFEAAGIQTHWHVFQGYGGPLEYIEYIPASAARGEDGSSPLLILLHGGGSSAEFITWVSEYPLIGREDGLVVLSFDHHVKRSSDEILQAVDKYIEEHPIIDPRRIYVSGFSMGSLKTQEFAARHGKRIAAVSPQSGSSGFSGRVEDIPVPVYYAGGQESPLPELPGPAGQENSINEMVENICSMNHVPLDEARRDPSTFFGYRPDSFVELRSSDDLHTITQEQFISEDGVMRTVFSSASNMTHCTLRCNCEEAWRFMREFTR